MERLEDALIGGQSNGLNSNNNNNNNINANSQNGDLNTNSMNPGTGGLSGNNNDRPTISYSMPGILHYLQHEWNRYELDRQQWEADKAELMTKISFLQGERRGQENLKNNLIRRIKMLELALKQERIKFHKLKYGIEPPVQPVLPAAVSSNDLSDLNEIEKSTFSISQHPILNKENTLNASTKQGRQILKQYLQEIGCTDTIIDIRSSRLRNLLGLKANGFINQSANATTDQFDVLTATNLLNSQNDSIASLLNSNNNTKQLLQLSSSAGTNAKRLLTNNNNKITNGYSNQLNGGDMQKILQLSNETDAQSMLMMTNLDFISNKNESSSNGAVNIINNNDNSNANISNNNNEEEDEDEEMNEDSVLEGANIRHLKLNGCKAGINNFNTIKAGSKQEQEQMNDLETENALNEFSFLSNESVSEDASDWAVDKAHLVKLTEQYKKDRKSTKSAKQQQQQKQQQLTSHAATAAQRPNRNALQAMIANLNENNEQQQQQQQTKSEKLTNNNNSIDTATNHISFSNSTKLFLDEEVGFNTSDSNNLGELSRISVNSSNLSLNSANDETIIDSTQRKTIANKFSLRGHFDSVRCLAFHPSESALVTGSEDQTIKLWNLDKSSMSHKKNINTDIEPVYTFRKHTGAVLSVIVSGDGDHLISAGLDSKIIIWNMPNYETTDQYDVYSSNVFVKSLNGHTDAVWGMSLVDNTLVSLSADSTVRVWNPFSIDELNEANSSSIQCLNENKENGIPTSVDFVNNDKSRIAVSFNSSHHNIYDLETGKVITKFDYSDSTINTHCYKVISYPNTSSMNSSLILSAHEDKKVRFFDINSGKLVYQMVAHQDACTDIAIDPTCLFLISASHDCSLRLWNLDNKSCVQDLTVHRKKYDESIHCVAFHPSKPFIASGGADAIVKIYV